MKFRKGAFKWTLYTRFFLENKHAFNSNLKYAKSTTQMLDDYSRIDNIMKPLIFPFVSGFMRNMK